MFAVTEHLVEWWPEQTGQVSSRPVMLGEEAVKDCRSEPWLLRAAFSKLLEE